MSASPLPSPIDWARLRGEHELAVYIDLKSPYAYLAIEPTRAMAQRLGVAVDWRPFTLDIPSYLGSARVDSKGKVESASRTPQQWSGVKYAYMDARRYANLTGRTVRGTVKIWDSSLAGISMLWAKRAGRLDAYLDTVYPSFWRRELDIEQVPVLEASLESAGIATNGFRAFVAGAGREEHDALNEAAFAAGIFGVPTYLVGDEMWFGREHLPRVEWLLSGRKGGAPEVANRSFDARPDAAEPEPLGASASAGRLEVLLDLRSPASYLALEPTATLGEEAGVEIDWLPHAVPPLRPPSVPTPGDDRGVRHRRHRARHIAREIEVYGRARGLELRDIHRDGSAAAFELGWLWLRERADPRLLDYLRAGFRRYWAMDLDPADVGAVAALLTEIGCDTEGFEGWCAEVGPALAERIATALRERGVGGVPGYRVDGEFFQGRQHLPMIRWILGGRRGPGPI
jgi:2-hydroxychromene-2-carboxylate isomerase